VRSFAAGRNRSISELLLSKAQTLTRLLVTLWNADWTRHNPTFRGGENEVGAEGDPPGPGVDERLPGPAGLAILYDWEIAVRAKNEVAAASISMVED
jgi:hypothetical protein